MIGKGSLAHNRREFFAENVEPDRVQLNICYQNENLKEKLPALSIPFYTSFYSWAVVLCGGLLIGRKRYRWLTPAGILLGYLISLAPGPCILVRYMAGIMLCVPVLWGVVFYGKREEFPKDDENTFDRKITSRYNIK